MRDDEKYQRRHLWMRTWKGERGLNGELLNDFVCIVEGEIVGRISEGIQGASGSMCFHRAAMRQTCTRRHARWKITMTC